MAAQGGRLIRTAGVVQAAKALSIRVPQIAAQQSRLTLARLVPNGTRVRQGDPLVESGKTGLLDEQREAIGKLGDIEHQVSGRRTKTRSNANKRVAQIRAASKRQDAAAEARCVSPCSRADAIRSHSFAVTPNSCIATLRHLATARPTSRATARDCFASSRK